MASSASNESVSTAIELVESSPDKERHEDLASRWKASEDRISKIEQALQDLNVKDGSEEEGRFEIMAELLDKACQAFEVYDEHKTKKIPYEDRLILESSLLELVDNAFERIENICRNFSELLGNHDGIVKERDELRYEIRFCDVRFYEIHERFLKSYLGLPW
ncbi:hypothetical protein DdX_08785 [Ditylenchus destructor]|uniref:Uncharacterized protein n=1 Tax=Ditylenchus destructor TaxID=166010 RepID=A0AAD4R724_9BILA|nr:hypothetical protein DdX_08785 [Ditylenchus destructor]